MSSQDLADLDAWEEAHKNDPPEPETDEGRIGRLFRETPEMQEREKMVSDTHDGLDRRGAQILKIRLPKAFIRMLEFIEANDANAGLKKVARPPERIISDFLMNDCHATLHALAVAPASFLFYRNLYNKFCDDQGVPDLKIAEPASAQKQREQMKDEDEGGPF